MIKASEKYDMKCKVQGKLLDWSPEKIRWYADACEYSGNDRNKKLAEAILDVLPAYPHVCDIGCGIGAVSLALAEKASKVTAVDINGDAVEFLHKSALLRGFSNIETFVGDFRELQPPFPKADCAVLCMLGGKGYIEEAKLWANGKLVVVTNPSDCHSFSTRPKIREKQNVEKLRAYLLENGYNFTERVISTATGQPFRSLEDAVHFISSYDNKKKRQDIIKMLNERLEETGRNDFPLYLPNNKDYLIFTVEL